MVEPIDVYTDMFAVTTGSFGANLVFSASPSTKEQTDPKLPRRVATVRMSMEHLKVMSFILCRAVKKAEADSGVCWPIPASNLSQLSIAPEDWTAFWAQPGPFTG